MRSANFMSHVANALQRQHGQVEGTTSQPKPASRNKLRCAAWQPYPLTVPKCHCTGSLGQDIKDQHCVVRGQRPAALAYDCGWLDVPLDAHLLRQTYVKMSEWEPRRQGLSAVCRLYVGSVPALCSKGCLWHASWTCRNLHPYQACRPNTWPINDFQPGMTTSAMLASPRGTLCSHLHGRHDVVGIVL